VKSEWHLLCHKQSQCIHLMNKFKLQPSNKYDFTFEVCTSSLGQAEWFICSLQAFRDWNKVLGGYYKTAVSSRYVIFMSKVVLIATFC